MLYDLVGRPAMPEMESAAEEEQETDDQKEDKKRVCHRQLCDESGDSQKCADEQKDPAQQHLFDVLEQF